MVTLTRAASARRPRRDRLIVVVAALAAAALALALAGTAGAATQNTKVQQALTVTVDDRGAAHFTDVLTYEPDFFSQNVDAFVQHPSLLKQNWNQAIEAGAVQNFASKIDKGSSSVTLTWDQPGYATYQGETWSVPNLGYTLPPMMLFPDKAPARTATANSGVLAGTTTDWYDALAANQGADWTWTATYKAPAGAKGMSLVSESGNRKLTYRLAYVPPAGNVFQKYRWIFAPLFVLLALGALAGIVFVLWRDRQAKTAAVPAAAGYGILAADNMMVIAGPAQPVAISMPPPPPELTAGPAYVAPVEVAASAAATQTAAGEAPPPAPPPLEAPRADVPMSGGAPAEATPLPAPVEAVPPPTPVEPAASAPAEPVRVPPTEPAPQTSPAALPLPPKVEPAAPVVTAAAPAPEAERHFCAFCGHPVTAAENFCVGCGKPLG